MTDAELLPASAEDFASQAYWDKFFRARGSKTFEWYGEWSTLQGPVSRALSGDAAAAAPYKGSVLMVGCGNSALSADMYDAGITAITNIDFSKVCVAEMMGKHLRARPLMRWLVMDALAMKFADASFDVALDKGALDALMGDASPACLRQGSGLLSEVARVLLPAGGRYLCISLLQGHVLDLLLRSFTSGWSLSIAQLPPPEDMKRAPLQPFLVVATAGAGAAAPLVECSLGPPGAQLTAVNAAQLREVAAAVAAANAARARGAAPQGLAAGGDPYAQLAPGRQLHAAAGAVSSATGAARFSLWAVDSPAAAAAAPRQCAVFLVPQGREHEWLFASEEGRETLRGSAGAARLILVAFGRGHTFGSSAAVQAELSPLVLPLAPAAVRGHESSIPFLTTDDGIGKRATVARAESALNGVVLVEDVAAPGGAGAARATLRRLVFASAPALVQSEVRLKGGSADTSFLCSAYHGAMAVLLAAALPAALPPPPGAAAADRAGVLLVGLGGGQLPSFLATRMHCAVHAVELDPCVVDVAKQHFGFSPSAHLTCSVGDGLEAVKAPAVDRLGAIIVDAGSNDASLAMTCPPAPFLEDAFLADARRALGGGGGCLLVNVVSRLQAARDGAHAALRRHFDEVWRVQLEEDLNCVMVARAAPGGAATGDVKALAAAAAEALSRCCGGQPFCDSCDDIVPAIQL